MKKILWTLAALPIALACAAEDTGDDSTRSAASEVARAEMEVQRHHDAVMNATDASQLVAETTAHDQRMRGILDELHNSLSDGMRCSHSGKHQMQSMMTTMEHAQREHMSGYHEDRSLEALQGACAAYAADMRALLEDMHQVLMVASCMQ